MTITENPNQILKSLPGSGHGSGLSFKSSGVPLVVTQALGFGLTLLIGLSAILGLSLTVGAKNTHDLLQAKAIMILDQTVENVTRHLQPAADTVRFIAMETSHLSPEDRKQAMRLVLGAVPQVETLIYVDSAYQADLVTKKSSKIEIRTEDWTHRYQTQESFAMMRNQHDPLWGDPVYAKPQGEDKFIAFLNVRMPVHKQDKMVGFYIAAVEIDSLSEMLRTFQSNYGETPYIMTDSGGIIAHPTLTGFEHWTRERASAEGRLPKADEIGDPVLKNRYRPDFNRPFMTDKKAHMHGVEITLIAGDGEDSVSFDFDSDQYVNLERKLSGFSEKMNWIVGLHFRLSQLGAELKRLWVAAVAAVFVAFLVVGLAVLGGYRITRPIRRLAAAAQQLQISGPADIEPLPNSMVRELNTACVAFNSMLAGLRERELLRETFGRYVPSAIVPSILADRGVLSPTTREATILFTDIKGFSTISERLEPERLVTLLNSYFDRLVEPIEARGGVIHQFQGDAILVTFNLPIEDPNHAAAAVETALKIQEILATETFLIDDEPIRLTTRIGINTGRITGGTVGGTGRLGYTVHGDAVNLAARIEQLNKEFGTLILVSQSCVDLCHRKDFVFEPMGTVPIRGREQKVILYRVDGLHHAKETPLSQFS